MILFWIHFRLLKELRHNGMNVYIPDQDIEVEDISEVESDEKKSDEDSDEKNSTKSIELMGMTIVQKGQYSKCPKCKKFIKSTFIIRHIKLHDKAVEKVTCPEKLCEMTFARINNLFRHLKSIHKVWCIKC